MELDEEDESDVELDVGLLEFEEADEELLELEEELEVSEEPDEVVVELIDVLELTALELFVAFSLQAASESSDAAARMNRHLCLVMMRPL
jgi:hypothetical protein